MRDTSGLWRGGSPGRPPGVPNRATRRMREFLQGVLREAFEDERFRAALVKEIQALTIDARVLQLLFAYSYGKPPASIDLRTNGPSFADLVLGRVPREKDDQQDSDDDESETEVTN